MHGLGTGTDARMGWALVLALGCLVARRRIAVWWRLAGMASEWSGGRTAAATLSVAGPLVILIWFAAGPMRPGWAARAGTPASLLGTSSGQAAVAPPSVAALQAPFTATLTGTVAETAADAQGNVTITIDGKLSAGASGHLQIVLKGPSDAQGGVEMASSAVTLGPTARSIEYRGQVTRIRGTTLTAALTDDSGRSMSLGVSLQIDAANTQVTGSVQATAG